MGLTKVEFLKMLNSLAQKTEQGYFGQFESNDSGEENEKKRKVLKSYYDKFNRYFDANFRKLSDNPKLKSIAPPKGAKSLEQFLTGLNSQQTESYLKELAIRVHAEVYNLPDS